MQQPTQEILQRAPCEALRRRTRSGRCRAGPPRGRGRGAARGRRAPGSSRRTASVTRASSTSSSSSSSRPSRSVQIAAPARVGDLGRQRRRLAGGHRDSLRDQLETSSPTSRDLPVPASACTTTTWPRPVSARRHRSRSRPSSSSRPTMALRAPARAGVRRAERPRSAPDRDLLLTPLHLDRRELLPLEPVAGRGGDVAVHPDATARRPRHQPRREVDRVAEAAERAPLVVTVGAAAQPPGRNAHLDVGRPARRRRSRAAAARPRRHAPRRPRGPAASRRRRTGRHPCRRWSAAARLPPYSSSTRWARVTKSSSCRSAPPGRPRSRARRTARTPARPDGGRRATRLARPPSAPTPAGGATDGPRRPAGPAGCGSGAAGYVDREAVDDTARPRRSSVRTSITRPGRRARPRPRRVQHDLALLATAARRRPACPSSRPASTSISWTSRVADHEPRAPRRPRPRPSCPGATGSPPASTIGTDPAIASCIASAHAVARTPSSPSIQP